MIISNTDLNTSLDTKYISENFLQKMALGQQYNDPKFKHMTTLVDEYRSIIHNSMNFFVDKIIERISKNLEIESFDIDNQIFGPQFQRINIYGSHKKIINFEILQVERKLKKNMTKIKKIWKLFIRTYDKYKKENSNWLTTGYDQGINKLRETLPKAVKLNDKLIIDILAAKKFFMGKSDILFDSRLNLFINEQDHSHSMMNY